MREAETPQIPSETGNRARRAIEKKKRERHQKRVGPHVLPEPRNPFWGSREEPVGG